MASNEITFIGETNFRNKKTKFGIKIDDRRRHTYIIGKTGMGKTVLLHNMAVQDIRRGSGMAFVDPHGEAAESLLDYVPVDRIKDVIYFNPADLDFPIAFNVMEQVDFRFRHLVANGLMGVFKKVWPDVWSARMEYILNNSILALLEYPEATILGVNRMLADPEYREKVVSKITDPVVKSFWVNEYARYTQRYEIEATAAIQNKVGQFVSNPLIRNIIGQVKSTIDMRQVMDSGKILILNLSKGRIGEDNSRLLGALLVTKLQLAAMSRVDTPEEQRRDFYLFVDEFQNFATQSFATILSEARKYRLDVTLGHQYITQMEEEVRDAVFGNVGTLILFRIGAEDAEFLEREFMPDFTALDLVNLGKYNIYLRLMIDGLASRPFSATTLAPLPAEVKSVREEIIKASRERYGIKKEIVEDAIRVWTGLDEKPEGQIDGQKNQGSFPRKFSASMPAVNQNSPLFNAICSTCGKSTKVIFEPSKDRPIYCKSCLKKMKNSGAGPSQNSIQQKPEPQGDNQSNPWPQSQSNPQTQSQSQSQLKQISLKDAVNQQAVSFSQSKNNQDNRPKKKEVDLSGLRKALEETMEKGKEKSDEKNRPQNSPPKNQDDNIKKGVINPGQTINF